MDTVSITERKQLPVESQNDLHITAEIKLVDGELGTYEKTVNADGYDVIHDYVPSGTYTVTNKGKWCKIYIAKDTYYKNSDGYMENEVVSTIEFFEYGETAAIDLHAGEHIALTPHATAALSPA